VPDLNGVPLGVPPNLSINDSKKANIAMGGEVIFIRPCIFHQWLYVKKNNMGGYENDPMRMHGRRRPSSARACVRSSRRFATAWRARSPGRNRSGGSGGSLEPPRPLLAHLHTVYMACYEGLHVPA
jgi:hypothetical protein